MELDIRENRLRPVSKAKRALDYSLSLNHVALVMAVD